MEYMSDPQTFGPCIDGGDHKMEFDYTDMGDDVYTCARPGCKAIYIVKDALGR